MEQLLTREVKVDVFEDNVAQVAVGEAADEADCQGNCHLPVLVSKTLFSAVGLFPVSVIHERDREKADGTEGDGEGDGHGQR